LRNKESNDDNDARRKFRIDVRELDDPYKYYKYFTKYTSKDVILFQRGTKENPTMQKIYEIGNWFIDAQGIPLGKEEIWAEIKVEMSKKERQEHLAFIESARAEQEDDKEAHQKAIQAFTEARGNSQEKEFRKDYRQAESREDRIKDDPNDPPANKAKLSKILSQTDDETLTDWFCILYGQAPIFDTAIPDWLHEVRDRKRKDLVRAIYGRISPTDLDALKELLDKTDEAALYDWANYLQGKPPAFNTRPPKWLKRLGRGRKRTVLLKAIQRRIEPAQDKE